MFIANSIQLEIEYRINLLINVVNSLVGFGARAWSVIYAMFNHADGDRRLVAATRRSLLFGVFMIFEAYHRGVPAIPQLQASCPDYVRTGNYGLHAAEAG